MAKYALIGGRLGHSFSKIIHEHYFEAVGENSTYELVETPAEELARLMKGFENNGYLGINVTIPHKKAVMEFLDEISPEAEAIGAVNTIKFDGGKLCGYNTDYYGFGKTLERFGVKISGRRAYILGTGGAAGAVSAYCRDKGAVAVLVSRTPTEGAIGYDQLKDAPSGGVLINCTPVGMYPDCGRAPVERVEGFESVVDLIYNPVQTLLLKKAADAGIKAVNGLYMLVAQAIYAQSIWHGAECDENVIDRIYDKMAKEGEA